MTNLDETAIINIFQNNLNKRFVAEDVEFFQIGKTKIVANTDTLVQSTDIPSKMNIGDAARKSVIACTSDFAAKGVKPEYGIISINLPKMSETKIKEIVKGFQRASKELGIKIIGGDTNFGKEIVFNVCIFGKAKEIVRRSGAKKGDKIIVTGPFGYTSVGLYMLLNKKRNSKIPSKALTSVLKPKSRIKFGIHASRYFTSSMDSSDGLSSTLNEMASQSKKKFVIEKIPFTKEIEQFAKNHKMDLRDLVFNGGEEYEIVFTIHPKNLSQIRKIAEKFRVSLIEIGRVESGNGVCLQSEDSQETIRDKGWKHFR